MLRVELGIGATGVGGEAASGELPALVSGVRYFVGFGSGRAGWCRSVLITQDCKGMDTRECRVQIPVCDSVDGVDDADVVHDASFQRV